MWHVSALPADLPGQAAIAAALEIVARELRSLATTFFVVDGHGEVAACVAHGSYLPPTDLATEVRGWEARLRGVDPLAPAKVADIPRRVATLADIDDDRLPAVYERIGVVNDARLLIRDAGQPVAGMTLWRPLRARRWSAPQLRLLAAFGPLIEMAYLAAVRADAGGEARLPDTLTLRQRQVARLVAAGATNSEIARALYVSPDTAKTHTRAVLAKLGVSSRRELAMLVTRPAAADLSAISWPPRRSWGELPIRLEGDPQPQRMLAGLLEWAAERIGEVAAGCAFLSARSRITAQAWGTVGDLSPAATGELHERLLSDEGRPELVHALESDRARTPVIEMPGPLPRDGRLAELVARAAVANPLLAVLRREGRVSGLVWLSRGSRAALDQRDAGRSLRGVHPLLELIHGARLGGGATTAEQLAALGLTRARDLRVDREEAHEPRARQVRRALAHAADRAAGRVALRLSRPAADD